MRVAFEPCFEGVGVELRPDKGVAVVEGGGEGGGEGVLVGPEAVGGVYLVEEFE